MEAVKEIKLDNNRVFRVFNDYNPIDPREWDNLGTMACFHRRYSLGDKDVPFSSDEFGSWGEMEEYIWKSLDAAVVIPLFMYDHGGITIQAYPFDCRWDSGQIGFIYVTKDKLRKEYGVKKVGKKILSKAEEILRNEILTYDQYVTGDVYSFEIVKVESCDFGCPHERHEDSCSGFFGEDIKQNGILDHVSKEDAAVILGQL